MKYYSQSVKDVIKNLGSINGLTQNEVNLSKQKYGVNTLKKPKRKTLFKRIIEACLDPMLIILEIACVITFGVNLGKEFGGTGGDFYECFGILFAVIISVFLTVLMEGKSQKAFELLERASENIFVKVKRNGEITVVSQSEIVVGDIILLQSGDKIVADGRLILSNNLETDESMLTGESNPVKKNADKVLNPKTPLAERVNCVYSGTYVSQGDGEMIVTAVGDSAEIGVIASDIENNNPVSAPLQEKLNRLGKLVAVLGGIASVFVLILSVTQLFVNNQVTFFTIEDAFLNSIILIVASVPEGLPTTVAIALSLNVVKLYKSNALIKKLVATETVGCVSVICSDKTGTLTENKMKVTDLKIYGEKDGVFANIAINSTADKTQVNGKQDFIGQPTETALLVHFCNNYNAEYKKIREEANVINRVPFSSEKKYMETTVLTNGKEITYIKGAPEIIIKNSNLLESKKRYILNEITYEQSRSKRVIAFARRVENITYFDGYAVIADSIRKDVYSSVLECQNAGINVKMLTGDDKNTAYSIAKELKIANSENQVILASELEDISEERIKELLKTVTVVARSTPKTKLKIVTLLKEMGEVVAVTGDGVNDAPAIKNADIGIAMGGGSQITKEASDIVLLDNSFSTIIKAISFGRNIYQNFQRFLTFQLSVNLTAVTFIIASLILKLDNPFTSLELLWINIIMDGPPALSLGLEERGFELMKNSPVKRSNNIVTKKMFVKIMFTAVFCTSVLVLEYKYNFLNFQRYEIETAIFNIFMFLQLFNAFNSRELGSVSIVKNFKSNKFMLIVFTVTMVLQIIFSQFLGGVFNTVPLSVFGWLKVIITAFSIILISEFAKLSYRIFKRTKKFIKINSNTLIKSKK